MSDKGYIKLETNLQVLKLTNFPNLLSISTQASVPGYMARCGFQLVQNMLQ